MPLLDKKGFAKICSTTTKSLATWNRRGKIVLDANGFYDTENETNMAFLEKRGVNISDGPNQQKPVEKPKEEPLKIQAKEKLFSIENPSIQENGHNTNGNNVETLPKNNYLNSNLSSLLRGELDKIKIIAEIEKRKKEIEKLEIENSKKRGELIPTELVMSVILLQSESLKVAYMDACEKFIIRISQKKKLTNKESAEIKKGLINEINEAVDLGIKEAKKGVKNIVNEYSEKLGVGEHG